MNTVARSFAFLLSLLFLAGIPVRGAAIPEASAQSNEPAKVTPAQPSEPAKAAPAQSSDASKALRSPSSGAAAAALLEDRFTAILQRHVRGTRVDYLAWASNGDDLHGLGEVIDGLSQLDPADWAEADAVAYWIDLYNALTVKLILDHYPLGSIKDLGGFLKSGPWSRDLVEVAGQSLTLNQIENEKLRPRTRDARIHFAINCASLGCPPLRNEAYTASRLASQLEDATTRVLHDERWLKIEDGTVFLSKLFDWYKEDFVEDAGSLRAFLARYRDDLPPGDYKIEFMDYSWRLNDLEKKES